MAVQYLSKLCRLIAIVPGHHQLRSPCHGQLDVAQFLLTTYGERSFICTDTWNRMPDSLKDTCFLLHYLRTALRHFSSHNTDTFTESLVYTVLCNSTLYLLT